MDRFDSLNELYLDYQQNEDINVYAMGVGQNNSVSINLITQNNNLPWVKSIDGCNVWSDWGAMNRDLFIMDKNNEIVSIINLTQNFDETQIRYIIENIE